MVAQASACELPTFSRRSPSAETRSVPPKDLDCVSSPNTQALVGATYKGHSLDQKEQHQLTSILRPFTPTPVQNSELFASFARSKLGRRRIDAASGFANDGTACRNVSAPTTAIAAWSVAHTFSQLFDPCVRWDASKSSQSDNSKTSQGSGAGLGPHGPCRIGNCHDSWSRARKHCAGNDRCGCATTAVGSIPMLCETPVAFTIAPLALVTGLLSLLFARRVPCAAVDTPAPMG